MKKIRVGTRGSKLALYQANSFVNKMNEIHPEIECEVVVIQTKGDKRLDISLSGGLEKGLFTKELEEAILRNEVDLAIHSLKDLPVDLPNGFQLSAVLERGPVRDLVISEKCKSIEDLEGKTVATSSIRRKAQLLGVLNNVNIIEIRGNVDTRIKKMKDGVCDAVILAEAGVKRLNFDKEIAFILPIDDFIPAPGQGIIGIESLEENIQLNKILKDINHNESWISAITERSFLRSLGGGCALPAACFSVAVNNKVSAVAVIISPDGQKEIRAEYETEFDQAEELGYQLAQTLLNSGGKEILDII